MQIRRGASRVYRGFRSNYNNNGSHNSVSPCDGERRTVSELPRVGAGVFSSLSMCLCTHRETLQVGVHRRRKAFIACLPCRLHGIPETQPSLLWARRGATRQRADRRVPYEQEKRSPLTSRGATPLSGESTLGKHRCAMGKSFGFSAAQWKCIHRRQASSSSFLYPVSSDCRLRKT